MDFISLHMNSDLPTTVIRHYPFSKNALSISINQILQCYETQETAGSWNIETLAWGFNRPPNTT